MTVVADRKFSSSERREFWQALRERARAVVVVGARAAVEQYVTESYDELTRELVYRIDGLAPVFVELHVVASIAPGSPTASIDDLNLCDPPLRRVFPASAIVVVRPLLDRDDDLDDAQDDESEPTGEHGEPVPFIRYDCETVENATAIEVDGERVEVPAGGIVCEVYTNDNDDDGSMRHEARWTTWAKDRAAFDRIVGKSRQGVISRCDVTLDGERVE